MNSVLNRGCCITAVLRVGLARSKPMLNVWMVAGYIVGAGVDMAGRRVNGSSWSRSDWSSGRR